ncbi:hypothetical protein COO60DRAFT_937019 [Scenedesmus sp. NREL 46B-D3]|nr:hypothetical protein COO60DRAFT_937019 [Scenedesmus sp. NREL 46B-D3]
MSAIPCTPSAPAHPCPLAFRAHRQHPPTLAHSHSVHTVSTRPPLPTRIPCASKERVHQLLWQPVQGCCMAWHGVQLVAGALCTADFGSWVLTAVCCDIVCLHRHCRPGSSHTQRCTLQPSHQLHPLRSPSCLWVPAGDAQQHSTHDACCMFIRNMYFTHTLSWLSIATCLPCLLFFRAWVCSLAASL